MALNLTEHEIQKQIMEYLSIRHHFFWRNNTGAFAGEYKGKKRFFRYGMVGSGDILGITSMGVFFSIEVKRAGKNATLLQVEFMDRVKSCNGLAFVARSVEDVIAAGL